MRIGELAERAGVSVRSLRYYEEQGLLTAERSTGGQRQYGEAAVDRVRFIQVLYAAGVPSRAVLQILPCMDTGVATPEMTSRLGEERDRIQAQIDELTAARDRLTRVIRLAAEHAAAAAPAACDLGGGQVAMSTKRE